MSHEEHQDPGNSKRYSTYINKGTIRNIIFFGGGIILFITGVICYGVILNLRVTPINEVMSKKGIVKFNSPKIVVERKSYLLLLYNDTTLVKSYRASFGRNVISGKKRVGDFATPVGEYEICKIDSTSIYYKFLGINYPNQYDLTEGLRKGLISQAQFDSLNSELYYKGCSSADTELGGNIGIHGLGRLNFLLKNLPFVYNWTNGSIAISNESIDELYSVIKKG